MLEDLGWLREHGHKLDRRLRHALVSFNRPPRNLPCVLHRPSLAAWQAVHRLPVIVELADGPGLTREWMRWAVRAGGRAGFRFPRLAGFSCVLPVSFFRTLVSHPAVRAVFLDAEVRACLDVASPALLADRVWAAGGDGRGVVLAVVDTGIYPHPDLTRPRNRILAFADFVGRRRDPYDDNGHGTHCAGDAAGNGHLSGGRYRGPAWEAGLVGVKVLNKLGSGLTSTIMAGIQWCVEQRERLGIRILSLSLGGEAVLSAARDPLCRMVEQAWAAGIVVLAAAGNSGPGAGTVGTPGIDPKIITVGAMDDRRTVPRPDDVVAPFSSRGPTADGVTKPDLLSPGVRVISLRAPGSYLDKKLAAARVGQHYFELSGTSMATPLAAGVAAQMLCLEPTLSPDALKERLLGTAQDRGYPPDVQGSGYLDAQAAAGGRAAATG